MSSDALGLGIDVTAVADGHPPDLRYGPELLALTDALTTRPDADPAAERNALIALAGPEAAERAIAACATFQKMNRLLDGVGAPIPQAHEPLARHLGFDPVDIWG